MTTSDIEHPGWRARLWPLRLWPQRWTRTREAPGFALEPYHSLSKHRIRRVIGLTILMLFCFIYGFFFSVLVPSNFAFLVMPVIAVAFLVIWALPDVNWAPTRTLEWLFFATFISLIVWPNYLAIALPGLPWITVLRLTSFPLVLTLLVCVSMSADFRSKLSHSLRSVPAIPILLCVFIVIQLYSIGLSKDISGSIQKFIVAQTTWTAAFFAGAYVFRRPGLIRRWAVVAWAMAAFVSLIAIAEYRVGHLLWLGHIPGFLKIQDESVQRILGGAMRAGTTRYRAQATFSTSLGLAEYTALALPFVMHFATRRFSQKLRAAALCSIPVILYGNYLTDAKLGMVGALFGILVYVFATAFRHWRRNKSSLAAASVLYSYPAALGAIVAALLFVHRFKILILGDGSHANSTNARIEQYTLGLQKILQWPFGYGIGQGAETLGFGANLGMISIDTYYLSIILEYGIVGFIAYYGIFAIAIYEGGRRSLGTSIGDEDKSFLLPITVSLITFIVIKSVFSQQDNHPLVFMMLGALMALAASLRKTPAGGKSNRAKDSRRAVPRL